MDLTFICHLWSEMLVWAGMEEHTGSQGWSGGRMTQQLFGMCEEALCSIPSMADTSHTPKALENE